MTDIKIVDGILYKEEVKDLIIEYTTILGRNLDFQGINEELSDLGNKYSGAEGKLLAVVSSKNEVMGCVAYHKHDDARCEMKRLFVKPEYRGQHLGELLVEEIIKSAKENGFKEMVLDTIEPLKSAIHLYKKFKFIECEPYYKNPMTDVVYMKLEL